MKCAWQELLAILPSWLAAAVETCEKDELQEIRLRLGRKTELVYAKSCRWLDRTATAEDMSLCINTVSRYSPWTSQSLAQGFLCAPGGHRIGVCGEAVMKDGEMTTVRIPTSLCIRVARDYPGIGNSISRMQGSILLIGPPGAGKTTLLRDLARQIAQNHMVAVVDERCELFPASFQTGAQMDILSGCPKGIGIERVLRTMGPEYIVVDEITAAADCEALLHAGWCGIKLLATAHAASAADLRTRPIYRPLWETKLFDHLVILGRDKSWREERMPV